jgi:L-gulonolactone oxidase
MRGTGQIRNWDGTQSWTPAAIHSPATEGEVAALVRAAAARGGRVKPLGSALSWSDIIDVRETAMRFDRLAEVLHVDPAERRVTVQSGIGMRQLNEVLATHGLAFENFGSIVMQTIGGYIGTGTHGTGGKTPILSSQIERMRLVDGLGRIRELDRSSEPELFSAARVNLGCLGVVTELTLRCVDAFQLEEQLELVDFDRALADLDHYVDTNDYCKLWWIPYTDKIQVYRFNRTDRRRTRPTVPELLDSSGVSGAAFTGLIHLSRRFPALIPWLHGALQRIHFRPHRRVDRSDRITRVGQSIPIHQETEYAIPRQRAAHAIEEVRRIVDRATSYRLNFPMEVRFVAADDIPMSPASGRDSCYVGGYIASTEWAPHYFADFEGLMHDYDGRPHWGKSFSRSDRELRALYPDYDRFAALRRGCDPHGVFRNSFVDRVFPQQSVSAG